MIFQHATYLLIIFNTKSKRGRKYLADTVHRIRRIYYKALPSSVIGSDSTLGSNAAEAERGASYMHSHFIEKGEDAVPPECCSVAHSVIAAWIVSLLLEDFEIISES
jgi:hypothetical protein